MECVGDGERMLGEHLATDEDMMSEQSESTRQVGATPTAVISERTLSAAANEARPRVAADAVVRGSTAPMSRAQTISSTETDKEREEGRGGFKRVRTEGGWSEKRRERECGGGKGRGGEERDEEKEKERGESARARERDRQIERETNYC